MNFDIPIIANLHRKLYGFNTRIKEAQAMMNKKIGMTNIAIPEELALKKERVNEQIKKINGFINVARVYATVLKEPESPEEYDHIKLATLMVRINGNQVSGNKEAANELYTRARAVLLWANEQMANLEAEQNNEILRQKNLQNEMADRSKTVLRDLEEENNKYFTSPEFSSVVNYINGAVNFLKEYQYCDDAKTSIDGIALGLGEYNAELSDSSFAEIQGKIGEEFAKDKKIFFPVYLGKNNRVLLCYFSNETERAVIGGIQRFIYNTICRTGKACKGIYFIDPIRVSNSSYGVLKDIIGSEIPVINDVPDSSDEARLLLESVIRSFQDAENSGIPLEKSFFMFHNFPDGYSIQEQKMIQQIYVNAVNYNSYVIVTSNTSSQQSGRSDVLEFLKPIASEIGFSDAGFTLKVKNIENDIRFNWFEAPRSLPEDLVSNLQIVKEDTTKVVYDNISGFNWKNHDEKGDRRLHDIVIGLDDNENVVKLDFEDSNFATFLCGAAGSGKSTLLHTILTDIIKAKHPDDVEIWLVDFKKTAFSMYIDNLPPHVRYIILDNSPELVYDIVDRLTEIMEKRKAIFLGRWQELKEVPKEKYMPSLFVVIDEFSEMSNILSESVSEARENYVIKMQTLLAEGRALGMHFIFASQGFTDGSRGLNEFAKKQIQQRIAMKTDSAEVRALLDLRGLNDRESRMIDQIKPHQALIRCEANDSDERIKHVFVAYIPDYMVRNNMIADINSYYEARSRYDSNDDEAYIYKRPLIIDGNTYSSFSDKREQMMAKIAGGPNLRGGIYIFIGVPKRMSPLGVVEISEGFNENVLLVASNRDSKAAASILISIKKSAQMQFKDVSVLSYEDNAVYRIMKDDGRTSFLEEETDCIAIGKKLHLLAEKIRNREKSEELILILGLENILSDYKYSFESTNKSRGTRTLVVESSFSKRGEGELDLSQKLALAISQNLSPEEVEMQSFEPANIGFEEESEQYNLMDDLKYVFTQGPKLGYHFVVCCESYNEFRQCKVESDVFKHKILFRMLKSDASMLLPNYQAKQVEKISGDCFRYSDGLDGGSYMPYIHEGISFTAIARTDGDEYVEEEYLL